MAYLLSLVKAEPSPDESTQMLCYYINRTKSNQIIRVMSGIKCEFERVVFSKERMLFEASPESYLEVYSCLLQGTRSYQIDCRSLCVTEKCN